MSSAPDRFQRVLAFRPDHETALGNSGIIPTEFKRSLRGCGRVPAVAVKPDYDWGGVCWPRSACMPVTGPISTWPPRRWSRASRRVARPASLCL